jgi:hypothetical protein
MITTVGCHYHAHVKVLLSRYLLRFVVSKKLVTVSCNNREWKSIRLLTPACHPSDTNAHKSSTLARSRWLHSSQVRREGRRVSGLHEDRSRSSELAHESFARTDTRDDTTAGNTFDDVFAVPGDKMAVVDDISFTFLQLWPHDQHLSTSKLSRLLRLCE